MRTYVLVSAVIFGAMTALQLVRLFLGWPVVVDGFSVPLWVSAIAALIAGTMAVWALRRLRELAAPPAAV